MENSLFDESFLLNLERLAILTRRTMSGQMQGERRSRKRGQSVEFSDFRPYASGDDFRRIDWNAYARLERFFIKLFTEEEDLTVHLLIDASRSMDWGQPNKLEYGVRLAGALGYIALAGLDRVTVTILGREISPVNSYLPPKRGKHSALALFNFLQAIDANGKYPVPHLVKYAKNAAHPGPAILVSDLMDDGWLEGINVLAGRGFETTILHILSPDELDPLQFTEPPLAGDFKLLDQESGFEVEVTANYETLSQYQQQLDEWRDSIKQFCILRNAHYVSVVTSLPVQDLLFRVMRTQGVLR